MTSSRPRRTGSRRGPPTEAEAEAGGCRRGARGREPLPRRSEMPRWPWTSHRRRTSQGAPDDAVEGEWREADRASRRRPRPGPQSIPTTARWTRHEPHPRGTPMRALAPTILRLLALVGKELIEVIRRPGALVSLVLGPFLIMAVFGLGFNGERRPARDGRRHPPRVRACPTDVETYQSLAGGGLHIQAVTAEPRLRRRSGRRQHRRRRRRTPRRGSPVPGRKQSIIEVQVNTVDPLRANYAGFLAATWPMPSTDDIRRAVEETEDYIAASDPNAPSSRRRSSPLRRRPRSRTRPPRSRRSSPSSVRRCSH